MRSPQSSALWLLRPLSVTPSLGWKSSDDPKTSRPFATEFDALGVRLNVAALNGSAFVAGNKPSRIEKVQAPLEETAAIPKLDKRQARVVHGNLNFTMGCFLRKSLMVAARAFDLLTTDNHRATPQQVQQLCTWTHTVVGQLAPKTVEPDGETTPVLIFTDAAYGDDVASCGIAVIDMISATRIALGGEIPKFLVEAWYNLGNQQVITRAGAFSVLLARVSFRSRSEEALEIIHGRVWQGELPLDTVADLCRNSQSLPSFLQHGTVQNAEFFDPFA